VRLPLGLEYLVRSLALLFRGVPSFALHLPPLPNHTRSQQRGQATC
jgi:hypothetical protein